MKPLFLLFFFHFLLCVSRKAPNCRVKRYRSPTVLELREEVTKQHRNGTCSGKWYDGSSWRGELKTRENSAGVTFFYIFAFLFSVFLSFCAGITLWWQNLLENPDCVKSIRIFLDGELAKDLERPGSKQEKIQIPYISTKCRIHSVLLTVEVDTNERLRCYQASIAVTHHPRHKGECNEETPGVQNHLPVSEEAPNQNNTTPECDVRTKPTDCTVQKAMGNNETSTGAIIACSVIGSGIVLILMVGITLWRKKSNSSPKNPPKEINQNNVYGICSEGHADD